MAIFRQSYEGDQFRESMKKSTAVGIFFIDSVRFI